MPILQTARLPERQLGGLERFLRHLDRPRMAVQSLLEGEPVAAGKNLANMVGELPLAGFYGPEDVPGLGDWWKKNLSTTRQEEPDWGIAGNIITDPLTYLTFGGGGAASAVGKTTLKQGAVNAVKAGLTKAGRSWADDLVRGIIVRLKAASPKLAKLSETKLARIAEKALIRGSKIIDEPGIIRRGAEGTFEFTDDFLREATAKGLIDRGGIKFGLPFTEGKTIALAGKDPLGYHPFAQVFKRGPGKQVKDYLGRTLKQFYGKSPAVKETLRRFTNSVAYRKGEWTKKLTTLGDDLRAGGIPPKMVNEALGDIAAVIDGMDARVLRAAKERTPEVVADAVASTNRIREAIAQNPTMEAALRKVQGWHKELYDADMAAGILKGSTVDPSEYMMRTYDNIDDYLKAAKRKGIPKANYANPRTFENIGDAWLAGLDPSIDPMKRIYARAMRHVDADEMRLLNLRGKALPFLEGAPVPLKAQITDEAAALLNESKTLRKQAKDIRGLTKKQLKTLDEEEVLRQITSDYDIPLSKTEQAAELSRVRGDIRRSGAENAAMLIDDAKALRKQARDLPKKMITDREAFKMPDEIQEFIDAGAGRLPPREGFMKLLATLNKPFKMGVTTGFGPSVNPAFHVRNAIFGHFQGITDPKAGLKGFRAFTPRIWKLVTNLDNPEVLRRMKNFGNYTAEEAADLIKRHNVLGSSFVSTEDIVDPTGTGLKALWNKVNFSRKAMERVEGQLRANLFLAFLEGGLAPSEAAERTLRAMVDYTMVSPAHRNIRDIIPFAQFTIGQTPNTIESVLRRPRLATPFKEGARAAAKGRIDILPWVGIDISSGEKPVVPEWISGQTYIPMGRDESGRPTVLTQLGAGLDDLNKINEGSLSETLRKTLLGSMTPSLKVPMELATNTDFFFGGDLDYNRTPQHLQALGAPEEMDPRLRKLLTLNPFIRQLGNIDKLLDDRTSGWQKAVNLLTGAKYVSIDEQREIKKRIKAYLEEKVKSGDVGVMRRFFVRNSIDPELAQIIKAYHKKR